MENIATLPEPAAFPETSAAAERDRGYYNLLSYIVSNAIAGEIMAIENYSEMVQLMPTVEEKIETVHQAKEECKHILLLSKLGHRLDFAVQKRIVEPQWNNIRKHFSAAVGKGDLAACLITQDLMTETMAIMLYRTLGKQEDTDSTTASVATNILADELEHLGIGIARIKKLLAVDADAVHDSLVWAHHRVMPELFSMISTSCHFLCDELNVDCGSLSLTEIRNDIESLRVEALEQYIDTLDKVGFDSTVTNALIASMASYREMDRHVLGLSRAGSSESVPCCGPGSANNGAASHC
ncbi:MAG TPA: ferritin-like domain-containing protein [Thermoanaerobaculia bacterium]|nr:ferritin-like domain-containing protein [Thermoanaerobaculia bacterium]